LKILHLLSNNIFCKKIFFKNHIS
jgi:hypothetical protein